MAHIKRREREGRRPDWLAVYRDPDGRERSKSFRRKLDAERYLTKVQHDILSNTYVDPERSKTTVEEYYRAWSERQPWRDSTAGSVAWIFEDHILPTFGSRGVGTIRRGDIEAWATGLPLAGQTARLALSKLSAMLEAAADDGYIPRNPARGAKRPRVDTTPVVPFTTDELDALTDAAPDWFALSITLGVGIGLRHGEATGLTADRIDFLGRTVKVDRQLAPGSSGDVPTFGPPKTRLSYRTVPLADVVLHSLARHIERHGTGPDGLVLHKDGRPVHRQRFGYQWGKMRRRAGVREDARFHDTRHTFAAVLLSGGVSVAAVADYMGHSPATLLRVYAHLIPADHDRARGVVQDAFRQAATDPTRTREARDAGL